jgi:hypothetical protein
MLTVVQENLGLRRLPQEIFEPLATVFFHDQHK